MVIVSPILGKKNLEQKRDLFKITPSAVLVLRNTPSEDLNVRV